MHMPCAAAGRMAARVAVPGGAGVVVVGVHFDRDQVHLAVVHAALGAHRVGEGFHHCDLSLQQDGFQTVVMIEVGVHGRHREVVVRVLQTGEPLGQIAFMVVEHIRKASHAVGGATGLLLRAVKLGAETVAHRLRPVAVAALRDPVVELGGQLVVEGMVKRCMS